MAEQSYLRQSPLAHLALDARAVAEPGDAGVTMAERRFRGVVGLRGRADDTAFMAAAKTTLGYALPGEANTSAGNDASGALWLGPDEWWVVTPGDGAAMAETLQVGLGDAFCAVTDLSESRTCIRVMGPAARDLLAKGCPLDLHPRVFAPGQCTRTVLAKAAVCIHQVSDAPGYEVYVLRSFADYLWRWLEDAAQEYGLAVLRG